MDEPDGQCVRAWLGLSVALLSGYIYAEMLYTIVRYYLTPGAQCVLIERSCYIGVAVTRRICMIDPLAGCTELQCMLSHERFR